MHPTSRASVCLLEWRGEKEKLTAWIRLSWFEVAVAQTSGLVNLVLSFIYKPMVKTEPAVASTRLLGLRWKLYPSNMACMLNRDLIRAESFSSTLKSSKRKKGCTGKVIIFKQTWNEQKFGIETFSHLHTKSSLFFFANRNDHNSSNFTRTAKVAGKWRLDVKAVACVSLHMRESNTVLDSGFHVVDSWVPGTVLQTLLSGTWILDSTLSEFRIPGTVLLSLSSGTWILDSLTFSKIPDSLKPYPPQRLDDALLDFRCAKWVPPRKLKDSSAPLTKQFPAALSRAMAPLNLREGESPKPRISDSTSEIFPSLRENSSPSERAGQLPRRQKVPDCAIGSPLHWAMCSWLNCSAQDTFLKLQQCPLIPPATQAMLHKDSTEIENIKYVTPT